MALASRPNGWVWINKEGLIVLELSSPEFKAARGFSDGVASVRVGTAKIEGMEFIAKEAEYQKVVAAQNEAARKIRQEIEAEENAANPSGQTGVFVVWRIVRAGTVTSQSATRMLEFLIITKKSGKEPTARDMESVSDWRLRFGWIVEQSGTTPVEAPDKTSAKNKVLREAYGPNWNNMTEVKQLQERWYGSFEK
jgi:hypothetical protein